MPNILITGASGGLGQELARRLKTDRFHPALPGRNADHLQAAYGDRGGRHTIVVGDCTTSAGALEIIEKSALAGRRLDGGFSAIRPLVK